MALRINFSYPEEMCGIEIFSIKAEVCSVGTTLIGFNLNWLNWLHFFILVGGPLFLIGCIIFLSPFLDAMRIFMSTVCLLAQLHPGILCLQDSFL